MRKIIITGGLGYIGMELSKIYSGVTQKDSVTVIDREFFSSRVSQLRRWGINFEQIDILDKEKLQPLIKDADIIFHLAGITNVGATLGDKNIQRDREVRKVGIEGTRNVIKLSEDNTKIIFPSTHVVFEGLEKTIKNIDEKFEPKPLLEYALGKTTSEEDLKQSNKNYVILRLGSVYGKSNDSMRINIMPNLFSKITSLNGEIRLFGGGKQLKSLVSVTDVARCMQFVGDNKEIEKEIFHCTNEAMTVKQVAEICKKINKKLTLVSTNDDIPNNGYTLSNTKLKNNGFAFLYNLEEAVGEIYESWRQKNNVIGNEIIEIGKDNYEDDRGLISNYYFDDFINMIGYVDSTKNSVRGNHYHPIQTQNCLLIKGKYISVTKDLLNDSSKVETRLVKEGELSTIPPNVAHTMVFLEDSILLNLVNGEREHSNYGITHTNKYNLVGEELASILIENYKTNCRVCDSEELIPYLSLGLSPLANNLTTKKNNNEDVYPLELNFCDNCSNSQLNIVVPPEKMFDEYLYLSSTTEVFQKHFSNLASKLKKDLNLNKNSLVVDIGSNDGIFLSPLNELGINSIGVEPAKNIARAANSKGLKTYSEYFDRKTVNKIIKTHGKADVVSAFNVFAHNDKLKEIRDNTSLLLKNNGQFIFEVQYILRTLEDLTFDNIYHEHVNYWCLTSLQYFFKNSDMKIYKVEEIDTHGGSIRVYATKNKSKKLSPSVGRMLKKEKDFKLDKVDTYHKFAFKVEKIKKDSLAKINTLISEGKSIIGYGAPAKATTILNYFGLNETHFKFTIDDNKLKQGKFIPETQIQIKGSDDIDSDRYDYVLVLAWNFFETIVTKNKNNFRTAKFIKLK
ncbi:MAG: hypothetical protein CMB82_04425 [Flammeovirgaceae bacterium]|nr:hypothetical protein [Flammeovirgaceae bacterium]